MPRAKHNAGFSSHSDTFYSYRRPKRHRKAARLGIGGAALIELHEARAVGHYDLHIRCKLADVCGGTHAELIQIFGERGLDPDGYMLKVLGASLCGDHDFLEAGVLTRRIAGALPRGDPATEQSTCGERQTPSNPQRDQLCHIRHR